MFLTYGGVEIMHAIMRQLHQDHINISRLLIKLEEHARELTVYAETDLLLMIDIVDFIKSYSDQYHHPVEDKVYQMFKSLVGGQTDIVDGLIDEHTKIPKITIAFEQLIEGALSGAVVISRKALSEKITDFIDIQRSHLNIEERELFPLIIETLSEEHWIELEAQIQQIPDPLFGSRIEEKFESLQILVN